MSRTIVHVALSCALAAGFLTSGAASAAKAHDRAAPCAERVAESIDGALRSAKEPSSSWGIYQRRIFQDAALMAKRVKWDELDREAAATEARASAIRLADDKSLAASYRALRIDVSTGSSARAEAKDASRANASFWTALASVDRAGLVFSSCLREKPKAVEAAPAQPDASATTPPESRSAAAPLT